MKDNSKIWNKINKLQNVRKKYYEYKDDLTLAKEQCSKITNGVSLLQNSQYDKVKSDCCDAIGEQPELLSALEFKGDNINELIEKISLDLTNGISNLDTKISDLNSEIESLYNEL